MPPSPFRRRKSAKTVRNLALIGGAVAAAAAALLKRDKVAGLLPSRSGEPAPVTPVPPQPSNYDAPGPVAVDITPLLRLRNDVGFAVASDGPLGAVSLEVRPA